MMTSEIIHRISQDLGIPVSRAEATARFLEDGSTIPFIARYRKEATGNLDESKIREIDEKRLYYKELADRKMVVLSTIEKQEKLTEDLRQRILASSTRSELEDLYLPFRPKRKTKGSLAIERGLEPLAQYIWDQAGTEPVETFATSFVNPEKEVPSAEEAIEGALHIIAERISETAAFRKQLRESMLTHGTVRASVSEGKEAKKTKYEMYYKFEEPVPRIPSHRMLAIRRGTRENVLTYSIEIDDVKALENILSHVIRDRQSVFAPLLERAAREAYDQLLKPSIQAEVRTSLRERAEAEAIRVFEENLRALLLAPPAGRIGVIGVDPGQQTGCKVAVIDENGQFLEQDTIYPAEPRHDLEGAEKVLLDLVNKHNVRAAAIGNGAASRETEAFARGVAEKHKLQIFTVMVNEAGASAYSASPGAREEFPGIDAAARRAISIARRLQDPLGELVKIDPKSIGVGQYQHDVDQKKLKSGLSASVQSCVNRVGVDPNTASVDLLKYVSGISERLARTIVKHREEHGPFVSRQQLRAVPGFNEKTFEEAIGFLRIKDGENPLDRTAVHPESYPIVERMAASRELAVRDLIGNPVQVKAIDFGAFENEAGKYTIADVRDELLKPGRDPRQTFVVPHYREDVKEISDLKEGMVLEGTITNVTNFGAFVDLGVHHDGLVHISELSHQFIRDARKAVKVADVVKVKVIGVDSALNRISLSIKATLPQPRPGRRLRRLDTTRKVKRPEGSIRGQELKERPPKVVSPKKPQPQPPKESLEDKIRLLQEKFRGPVG